MKKGKIVLGILFIFVLAGCSTSTVEEPTYSTSILNQAASHITSTPEPTIPTKISRTPTITQETGVIEKTVTPTKSITPTASFTPLVELSPTPKNRTAVNRIYVWHAKTFGYLDPENYNPYINTLPPINSDQLYPGDAFALSFSRYSEQIAYLTREGEISLWISDLALENVYNASDIEEILNLDQFPSYIDTKIDWGPGDNYIIINGERDFAYSVFSDTFYSLAEKCNMLGISPLTQEISLWCLTQNGKYLVMEPYREEWQADSLPEDGMIPIIDHVFSPNGSQVLAATQEEKLILISEGGAYRILPYKYIGPEPYIPIKTIRWTGDGTKLLLLGEPEEGECPIESGTTDSCWMLLDAQNGAYLWSPPIETSPTFSAITNYDGSEILIFHWDGNGIIMRFGIKFTPKTSESILLYDNDVIVEVYWDDNGINR